MTNMITYQGKLYSYIKSEENERYTFQFNSNEVELTKEELDILNEINALNIARNTFEPKGIVSYFNDKIEFEPFQYKPYFKLTHKNNKQKCIYIADEVGVGKTFETGIILSELLFSEKLTLNDSVLIVCPNLLCRKWQDVLKNYFGLSSTIIKNITMLHKISIISYEDISKITMEEQLNFSLGLLVIDEAHILKATSNRGKNLLKIRENSMYTVLISATPLTGKSEDINYQTNLLFNQKKDVQFDFSKESIYLSKTLKDIMRSEKVTCTIINKEIDNKELIDFLKISESIFSGKNTLGRFVGLNMIRSSPTAANNYLEYLKKMDKSKVKKLLFESNINNDIKESLGIESYEDLEFITRYNEEEADFLENVSDEKVEEILNSIEKLGKVTVDSKLNMLKDIINTNKEKYALNVNEAKFYKKMIIFTNYRSTAEYLAQQINKSILITGSISGEEKWKKLNLFEESADKDVLIITNVACEGQDFDFCNTLINYDLMYNPVQLVQRKGRIDRFKIKKKNIFIYNFLVKHVDPSEAEMTNYIVENKSLASYRNSIYKILLEKIREISNNTGVYYHVIDTVGQSTIKIDKSEAQQQLLMLFNEFYSKNFMDLEDVRCHYQELFEGRYTLINNLLQKKGIELSEKNVTEYNICLKKSNNTLLKYVLTGENISSHIIYNT